MICDNRDNRTQLGNPSGKSLQMNDDIWEKVWGGIISDIVDDLYERRKQEKKEKNMKKTPGTWSYSINSNVVTQIKSIILTMLTLTGFICSWPAFTPVSKCRRIIKWPVYAMNWYILWLLIATSPLYESLYFWQTNHYPKWLVNLNNELNSFFFMF